MSLIIFLLLFACQSAAEQKGTSEVDTTNEYDYPVEGTIPDRSFIEPFERDSIKAKLQNKIDSGEPLIVHCLVPLCDNEHQGIVPTTESLGNGFSTRTNLYWATSNGQKRFFERHANWKSLSLNFDLTDTILERVAFQRKFQNGAKVILVCDAYRGDQMEACLDDYFAYLSGYKSSFLDLETENDLIIGDEADLIAFNGHNGLMDVDIDTTYANIPRQKDAVAIACSSRSWFNPYFLEVNAYPLVTTTNLLYPGAFILNGIIEKWAMMDSEENIRFAAGDAYHEVKQCGQRSGRNLFATGWGG
ncbi:MAG: hypothetical protein MI810_19605 [Flavobacteriales bacterium]|nr:hypothetical protein [Flavobacteriales bacterium]